MLVMGMAIGWFGHALALVILWRMRVLRFTRPGRRDALPAEPVYMRVTPTEFPVDLAGRPPGDDDLREGAEIDTRGACGPLSPPANGREDRDAAPPPPPAVTRTSRSHV